MECIEAMDVEDPAIAVTPVWTLEAGTYLRAPHKHLESFSSSLPQTLIPQ